MTDDFHRNVHIDTRFDSYRNFFSDDWGSRLATIACTSAKLFPLIFDLMMEWRGAAYTASLPVSILEHVRSFHDGFVNTGEINTTLLRLAQMIPAELARDLPDMTTDPSLVRRLQERIVDIGARLEDARGSAQITFPMEETWQSYLGEHAYQLSLWGSQRICYVSIYNSYENFLVQCVKIAGSLDDCRTTDKAFKKRLADLFGPQLKEKCWTNNELNIVRLVRHALTHAGDRVTKQLAKQNHGFVVLGDRIQVTPDKTKGLFSLLKDAVSALAEKAAKMSEFA